MKKLVINTLASAVLLTAASSTITTYHADAATLSNPVLDTKTVDAFNKGKVISTKKLNAEMLKLINKDRKLKNVPALKFDASKPVMDGLNKRADEVTVLFSHMRPNGQLYNTAFSKSIRSTVKSENAVTRSYGVIPEGTSAEKYIAEAFYDQWKVSSQHHGNMMNKKYKKTAIQARLKFNKEKQKYYYYGVQIFKTK